MLKNYDVNATEQLNNNKRFVKGEYSETMFDISSKHILEIEKQTNEALSRLKSDAEEDIKDLKKLLTELKRDEINNAQQIADAKQKIIDTENKYKLDAMNERLAAEVKIEQQVQAERQKIKDAADRD